MNRQTTRASSDRQIEILPPEREPRNTSDTVVCLCCQQKHLASLMDVDGCGICEDCLAPR
ncbi:hypothetical protein DQW09_29695 (plasmid) [Ensifer adhaerens]|nr:hypothetical protein B9J07_23895 [Sinorhizobium sp. LM21]QHG74060.1 hypothetical protein DQW09_29695 [Ensifer adhaerens]THA62285.1 hypothetical protein E5176_23695 [Ensifer adhaerens]